MKRKIAASDREIAIGRGDAWERALAAWDDRLAMAPALEAAEILEQLATRERSAGAWAWCARVHYFIGDYQEDARERVRWHEAGYRLGRRGVAVEAGHVPACFWTSCCLGSTIEPMSTLKASLYFPELIRNLKRVLAAEPRYYHGGLARWLGQSIVRRPGWTERLLAAALPGVGSATVLAGLRRASAAEPPFVLTLQTLGELAYHAHGDRATVREMLERLDTLELDRVPNVAPENHLDRPRARRRLTELLDGPAPRARDGTSAGRDSRRAGSSPF